MAPEHDHPSTASMQQQEQQQEQQQQTSHHVHPQDTNPAPNHHQQHQQHPTMSPSSRASELGRRLAQERQTNHQLLQQVHELRRSHREQPAPPNHDLYLNHIRELQNALRLETERRENAERQLADCFVERLRIGTTSAEEDPDDGWDADVPGDDDGVAHLLERAEKLLSHDDGDDRNDDGPPDSHDDASQRRRLTYDASYRPAATPKNKQPLVRDSMKEFQSLLEGFYLEQQRRQHEPSPTAPSREDVLWLFEELEWRFEEIRRGYEEERARRNHRDGTASNDTNAERSFPVDECKACLRGLMEIVASRRGGPGDASARGRTGRALRRATETMEQNHKTEKDEMSKTIETLESKIEEQNEAMDRLRRDGERLESALENERRTHRSSRESMTARIHYLEGIVRSLASERGGGKAAGWRGVVASPRGDYLRSTIVSMEFRQAALPYPDGNDDGVSFPFRESPAVDGVESDATNGATDDETSFVLCLRRQIEELGTALQQSEEERANAIEEFQYEREHYIQQYKEMSDLLKRFLDSDNVNCNGNRRL